MELLTGRRSVDKTRPHREQNLVEWAKPMLKNPKKLLSRLMDPRLEGQYPEMGAQKAASLAYQCLSHSPKPRPKMCDVIKILEPLKDFNDNIPIGTFVYSVFGDSDLEREYDKKGSEKGYYKQRHDVHEGRIKSPKSRVILSKNSLHGNLRKGLDSPLHNGLKRE